MMKNKRNSIVLLFILIVVITIILISGCATQRNVSLIELSSSGGIAGIVSEISISKVDDAVNVKKIDGWNNTTCCGTVNIEEFKKLEELISTNINSWKAEYLTDVIDAASDKIIIYFKDGEEKSILVYDFPNEEVPHSEVPHSLSDAIELIKKIGNVSGSCEFDYSEKKISFSTECVDIADMWTNLPQDKMIEECNIILNQQTADLKNMGFEPKDCEVIKAEAEHCTEGKNTERFFILWLNFI